MKPHIKLFSLFLLLTLSLFFISSNDILAKKKKKEVANAYPSINLSFGGPAYQFADEYNSSFTAGFDFSLVFSPFTKLRQFELGLNAGYLFSGTDNQFWDYEGIFVDTQNNFYQVSMLSRIRPLKGRYIEPFLEFSIGKQLNCTNTNYKPEDGYVDEDGDEEKIGLSSFSDWSNYFDMSLGLQIDQTFLIKLTYRLSPVARYINKGDVIFRQDKIYYKSTTSKVQIITLSLGINLGGLFTIEEMMED